MNELEKQLREMVYTGRATVGGVGRINRKLKGLLKLTNERIEKKQNADKSD